MLQQAIKIRYFCLIFKFQYCVIPLLTDTHFKILLQTIIVVDNNAHVTTNLTLTICNNYP